jgi:hypothetical protein
MKLRFVWKEQQNRLSQAAALERALRRASAERPRWLLALSLLSMLLGAGAALLVVWITGGAIFCAATSRSSGSDIPLAGRVVLAACAFGFFASIFARRRPLFLALVLSLTACALLAGIVLVARDSATTTQAESCDFMGTYTRTATYHFWYVGVVWGVAAAVLVLQLRRAIRFSAGSHSSGIKEGGGRR